MNVLIVVFLIVMASVTVGAMFPVRPGQRVKWGILFRLGSWWVGSHWSEHNRRLCVNLVPMFTLWITRQGGETPDVGYGFDIYRNDK